MKYMKLLFIPLTFALVGCASSTSKAPQPKDKVPFKEGTWTNDKLRQDSMLGMQMKLNVMGCDKKPVHIQPYIVQDPTGAQGKKQWIEAWSVFSCGKEYRMIVHFKEDGKGGASYKFP